MSIFRSIFLVVCITLKISIGYAADFQPEHLFKLRQSYLEQNPREIVELHFFWTTGLDRVIQGDDEVHIGGIDYGSVFPKMLSGLLAHSPDKLRIRLVHDDRTLRSNPWINELCEQYPARFKTYHIEHSIDQIIAQFPGYEEIARAVFKNATWGNPAIASDIYRLIGMPFMEDPTDIAKIQYTYVDVDTFCYALAQQEEDQQKLMKVLFSSTSDQISTRKTCNDFIKVSANGLYLYKEFCLSVLEELTVELTENDHSMLYYFPNLYNMIDQFNENKGDIGDYLKEVEVKMPEIIMKGIVYTTGPGFLERSRLSNYIKFLEKNCCPVTFTAVWNPAVLYNFDNTEILSFLNVQYSEDQDIEETSVPYIEMYHLIPVAKKFGTNHLFYRSLITCLTKHYPDFSKILLDVFWGGSI